MRNKGEKSGVKIHRVNYISEIGTIEIVGTETDILSASFVDNPPGESTVVPECLTQCINQLDEYFQGKRRKFSFSFQLNGTDFEINVWKALLSIPYGKTQSYADVAGRIGRKNAYRAVGNANRKNKIAIIIPCHRVIGRDGSLTGYSSRIWRKKWLLEHEKKHLKSFLPEL